MKRIPSFAISLATLLFTTQGLAATPIALPGVFDDKVIVEEPSSGVRVRDLPQLDHDSWFSKKGWFAELVVTV